MFIALVKWTGVSYTLVWFVCGFFQLQFAVVQLHRCELYTGKYGIITEWKWPLYLAPRNGHAVRAPEALTNDIQVVSREKRHKQLGDAAAVVFKNFPQFFQQVTSMSKEKRKQGIFLLFRETASMACTLNARRSLTHGQVPANCIYKGIKKIKRIETYVYI